MNEEFFDVRSASPDFVDLRARIDDKRVLRNPHKGWYMHYIDNGYSRPGYRDGIPAGDHLEYFPALNHLYLRIDWVDIEKEEGCFDWSYIDQIFDEWSQYGYKFSFRLCCFEATGIYYATPEWVRKAGANGTVVHQKGVRVTGERWEKESWEPDYGDPVFLEKLENFLREFGRKYNGHPLVEFVDIGTFGTWGEGHTSSGSLKTFSADVLRRHVDLHLKYLPDTQLLLNDDMVTSAYRGGASSFGKDGVESANRFADYCAGKGVGIRDDSVCVEFYSANFGYDTLRQAHLFDHFSPTAPVDLEFEHYAHVTDDRFKDGYAFLEALRRTHATYAGFHGYPKAWLEKRSYFTEYVANRLGYWYFLTGLNLPECVSGMKTLARLQIENRGMAAAYSPYRLEARAVNGEEVYPLFTADGWNLRWETKAEEVLRLDFANVPAGTYSLEIGLFEGDRPIQLAIKEEFEHGGFYKVCDFCVK